MTPPLASYQFPEHWVSCSTRDVGEAVVASLAAGGVEKLFFCSGSEIAFFQESIARAREEGRKTPQLITILHENVALNAALGYAAATGKPAATAAHVDVGTQHYGSAIHTAWRAGLPVVITAGAPPTGLPGTRRGARDGGHFWLHDMYDQNGIVRQYMKWDHRLEAQDNPGLIVSRALQVAQTPPYGPVFLCFPREVVLEPLAEARFPTPDDLGIGRPPAPNPAAVDLIAERLIASESPVIVVAGSGKNPSSVAPLVALCELLAIAVVDGASRAYHCFPMDHPLYQAAMGLEGSDFVLVLDADVPWVPGPHAPLRTAFVASADLDPAKLTIPLYDFEANLRVVTDPQQFLEALLVQVRRRLDGDSKQKVDERARALSRLSERRKSVARDRAVAVSHRIPIDPLWLACCIGDALDDNCVLVDDTLSHNPLDGYLALGGANRYFRNPGSAGGWGPGAALGVKLGMPDKDVVMVTGDGFYMFGAANAAIWSARQYHAPFLTVIFQNRSYSTGTRATASLYPNGFAVRSGLEGGYFDPPIDLAKEAEAAGAYAENVRDPAEVLPAIRRGLEQVRFGVPAVIAVWLPRILQED
jgi:acetolactate synthase-1/2/3 large subunit